MNAVGALFLAFFNTFYLRDIKINSSHINSFMNVSVTSCTNKMHRENSVSFLPEVYHQLGRVVLKDSILFFTTALLIRGFGIFVTSLHYQTPLEINTFQYAL